MISADLSGLEGYIGSVAGIVQAIASPEYQGNYLSSLTDEIKTTFRVETIAAKDTGEARVAHIFEWKPNSLYSPGTMKDITSDVALFRFRTLGGDSTKIISFDFLQSRQAVPLPDPQYYGFDSNILTKLNRHVFSMKAVIMESGQAVNVSPSEGKKLFIPSTQSDNGFVMLKDSVQPIPGGENYTGGFAEWWNTWFASRAVEIVKNKSNLEEIITKDRSIAIIRNNTNKTFAKGKSFGGIGNIDATQRAAYLEMITKGKYTSKEEDY